MSEGKRVSCVTFLLHRFCIHAGYILFFGFNPLEDLQYLDCFFLGGEVGTLPSIRGSSLSKRTGLVRNISIPDAIASCSISACATPVRQ